MAQTIKIKRSSSSAAPTSLGAGELAYSSNSQKLFVGSPAVGNAVTTIGGDLYVAMLDHSAGTLTASSAVIVGSDSKIDQLKTGSTVITGANNTIATTSAAFELKTVSSGNITITSAADLILKHGGTLNLATQANSLTILDDNAAALDINEGGTSYIKLITTNGSEEIELGKNVDLNGTLDVSGAATVSSLTSNTSIASTGNLTVNTNKFSVAGGTGNTIIAGTLNAQDNVDFDSDLNVDGNSTFNGNVTLGNAGGDTITVTGTTTFTPSVDFDGGLTIAGSQTVDAGGNKILNVGTPVASTDAANKGYVDAVKQALDIKDSVRVATTANIASTYNNGTSGVGATITADANGAISIDDVSPTTGNRILVKNQTDTTENGIYTVTTVGDGSNPFVLTRAIDNDSSADMTGGVFCFVEEGTVSADAGFVLSNVTGSATLGTTGLGFTQFSGAGSVTAGVGLGKTGNTLSVNVDDASIEINSDTLRLKGVTSVPEGVLLYGANTGGSFASLSIGTYDSTNSVGQVLQVGANGTIAWSNNIDGGTF
ncbi:hypothetical protein N9S10_02535 [Gammaproteobacteria bacterium]|jgi:hypothetical protein|nr:hypothetical protein [Gammaproteobacteria bacterium]